MTKRFSTQSDRSDITTGVLTLAGGARQLEVTRLDDARLLYQAEFADFIPVVADNAGAVMVDYPHRVPRPRGTKTTGSVRLAPSVSWALRCTDAITALDADLSDLAITSIDIECPIESSVLRLPTPVGATTVQVRGPARDLTIVRPVGVPVDIRVSGSASSLAIDGYRLGSVSRGYRNDGGPGEARYLITFDAAVTALTVSSDKS